MGSTPTSEFAATVNGVTEIRPGTYVFNDVMMVKAGFCTYDQCAAKVTVTVISMSDLNVAIIDGGSKTFSTDFRFNSYPLFLDSFGKILEDNNLKFERLTEEHGMVRILNDAKPLTIGDRLTIIPNHICTTINLHDRVCFIDDGRVVKEVAVAARGKVY